MNKTDYSFIRYSNCWEDTRIVLEALDIHEGETGISIASAGDNTIAMLLKNPKRVYAFDVNPSQLCCLELKLACFRCLSYEQTLVLLGVRDGDRISLYKRVRPVLSAQARLWLDENNSLIAEGIIHAGKFEKFFGIFRRFIIPVFSSTEKFRTFARLDCVRKQKSFYNKYIYTRRLKAMFGIYFGYRVMGRLGRDKSFYNYVGEKEESGNDIRARFEYGIANTVNRYNPYINYIVYGNYSEDCLPLYLRPENYDIIRRRIDRIIPVRADLMSIGSIRADFANLSDIFEYMSGEEAERNYRRLAQLMNPGGRAVYFNMQNRRYISGEAFRFDEELSQRLFRRNNSWFYRDFRVYRRTCENEQDM